MGMPLYGMQPPTGYSTKADIWVNSAALLARMNFALGLVNEQDSMAPTSISRSSPETLRKSSTRLPILIRCNSRWSTVLLDGRSFSSKRTNVRFLAESVGSRTALMPWPRCCSGCQNQRTECLCAAPAARLAAKFQTALTVTCGILTRSKSCERAGRLPGQG